MQRTTLLCLSLILFTQLSMAQHKAKQDTTYNQKVVLEREFNPAFKDASRIEVLPPISEPKREKQPIQYQFSRLDAMPPLQWKIVAPEKKLDRYNYSHQTGYINIGLGLPTNSLIYGGIELLNDETNRLDLTIDHRAISDNRKSKLNDTEQKIYNADSKIGLAYHRPFEFFAIDGGIAYTHSEFNYFSQNQTTDLSPYFPYLTIKQSTFNQANNQLLLHANATSTADGDFSYQGRFAYNYFGKSYGTLDTQAGPKEHYVLIDGTLKKQSEEQQSMAIDFSLHNFIYNNNANEPLVEFKGQNYALMSLTPRYNWKQKNIELSVGLKTEFNFQQGISLKIAPAANAIWEFSPKFFLLADIGGGTAINSFAQSDINYRFLHPAIRLGDTFTPFDGQFRIKTNIYPRLEVELSTRIKSGREYYFEAYTSNLTQLFPIACTNTNQYSVGISAKYDLKDYGDIQLSLKNNKYRLSEIYTKPGIENIAWNKPSFEMALNANIKINDKITAQIDYQLASGRYALYNNETVKMKPINQLDMGGRYRINKRWSAFAQMNNILLQNYDLWHGMPAQNFNFIVGAGFSY